MPVPAESVSVTSESFNLLAMMSLTHIHQVRVAYEAERLKQLGKWAAEKDSLFSLEDRMGLVSDSIVLAQAGMGKTSAALDLILGLHHEEESE